MRIFLFLFALTFTIKSYAQPGGVDCSTALANRVVLPFSKSNLSNCGTNNISSTNVTTCNASWDYQYLNGDDRMYVFIAPSSVSTISIEFTSNSQNVGLFLYKDCPNTSTNCVAASTGASGNSSFTANVIPDATYYLIVSSKPNATNPTYQCHDNYSLSITPIINVLPTQQDCLGAINLCTSSGNINFPSPQNSPSGVFINELPSSCLTTNEKNSTWFKFEASTTAQLSFTITSNTNIDYDYIVIDITNSSCYDIKNNTAQQIQCNYSASLSITGANGLSLSGCSPPINVIANHSYVICTSSFSNQPGLVDFNWQTSSSLNLATSISSINTIAGCSSNTIDINFSNSVVCNQLDLSKFLITDGTTTYSINTSPTLYDCSPADMGINNKTLTLINPLTNGTIYTLYAYPNAFTDVCGISNATTTILTFTFFDGVAPSINSVSSIIECGANSIDINFNREVICDQIDLSKFLLTDGTSTYSINASAGLNACTPSNLAITTKTITFDTNLTYLTTYTFQVLPNAFKDECGNGNSATSNFTFTINPYTFSVSGNTTIYSGFNASLTASGIGDYTWSNGSVGSTLSFNPTQTTTVSVTGINAGGCSFTSLKTISVLQNSSGISACNNAAANQITLPYFQTNLTNCGSNAFSSINTVTCGNASYLSGQDKVYAFTALTSGFVITTLTTALTTTEIGLMMYRGCPTLGQCIGNANGKGGTRIMQSEVEAGQTYYILVSTWATPNCIANYSLSISEPGGALQGTPKVDCIAATPICATSYTENAVATNEGFPPFNNEINGGPSCMNSGERKGFWYSFTVSTPGLFEFYIDPIVNTTDYDWVLFDITSYTCADIYNIPSLEIRCNWSGISGNTGISATLTGAQWESAINVTSARNYMLYVSNFTQSANGYEIYLGGTAGYGDNVGPSFIDVLPATCGDSTLVVTFTEPINCTAMVPQDFTLNGPGGAHIIDGNYTSPNCIGANLFTYVNKYTIKFSPPITLPGVYTFTATVGASVLFDKCLNDNNSNPEPTPIITFTIAPLTANASVLSSITCNGYSNGIATAVVPSSIVSYTYLWNTNPVKTTKAISALAAGTYSVVVTSPTGCSAQPVSVVINQQAVVPIPTIPIRSHVYCQNTLPPALVATFTGAGGGQVRWYTARVGGAPSSVAPSPNTSSIGRKIYYVSQNLTGCESVRDSIIVDVLPAAVLTITGPSDVCVGQLATYTVSGATSYTWSSGNITDTEIISPISITTISVTGVSTATCNTEIEKSITIKLVDTSVLTTDYSASAVATNALYQWIICNNLNSIINGETAKDFEPIANGNYAVIVTQNNCTDTSACVSFVSVGIEDNNKVNTKVSVYPNPTVNSEIFIKSEVSLNLLLVNQLNQIIEEVKLNEMNFYTAKVKFKSSGVYYLKGIGVNEKIVVINE